MCNVIWEPHVYELLGNIPSTQAAVNARMVSILKEVQYANSVKSVDGVMPCIIGEYGMSVSGDGIDVNGTQTVIAVQMSACGSCAWTWAADANHDRLQKHGYLTSFGREVKQYLAGNTPATWRDTDGS